jgi:hypothetical protein
VNGVSAYLSRAIDSRCASIRNWDCPASGDRVTLGTHVRHLVPASIRRAAARAVAARRASEVEKKLDAIARSGRPIVVGPWLGEVGFELLYWIPFVRWFTERYEVPPERLIAVSRGGAAAWYAPMAGRSHDALAFMTMDEFRGRNDRRNMRLGEQKQVAVAPLDEELIAQVRRAEQREVVVLHPSLMYRLFAPYWWGHEPIAWVRRYMRFTTLRPPALGVELPESYTAVKFYFNDCFTDAPVNRAFVDRTIRELAQEGPVISLSTGVHVDDHLPCEPDVAAIHGIRHLLTAETNLLVQAAIVARARRFIGTYGGFAYLAPLCGVPAVSYFTDPGTYSMRHLDLMLDVLDSSGHPELLRLAEVRAGAAVPD